MRIGLRALLGLSCAVACQTPPPGAARPAASAAPAASVAPSDEDESGLFESPERRSAAPKAAELPELPEALRAPIDVTFELETRPAQAPGRARREDVARTADRIHVRLAQQNVEWLFVRNPLDGRRVSATLVDHRQRLIIEYPESELRMTGIARGWADVASLGIGAQGLTQLAPTGRRESRFGFDFVELSAGAEATASVRQVWWSDAAALALRVERGTPPLHVALLELRRGVDRERFVEPRLRFSAYSSIDVSDYREKHHESEPAALHQHGP